MSEFKFRAVVKKGSHSLCGIQVSVETLEPKVDRPITGGWGLEDTPRNQELAARLVKAINDGAAISDPEVRTDVNGKTFVNYRSNVLGKRMNADLKRLGY